MINFVVALQAEARPIIDAFKLQKRGNTMGFSIYSKDSINLIISGIGKITAATATAYLQGIISSKKNNYTNSNISPAWLNIGIAGSSQDKVGHDILAHRIIDKSNNLNYYPTLSFKTPCLTADVITVDEPEINYNSNAVYDMEAAGFFIAASQFSSSELIHCYKIISDNKVSSTDKITKSFTTELIHNKMATIIDIVSKLSELEKTMQTIQQTYPKYETILNRWHFTVTQQHQLQNILRRWHALTDLSIDSQIKSTFNSADIPNLIGATKRQELHDLLAQDIRKIIVTTIFKFGESDGAVQLSDEK